jgi:23S rRNA (adenine2030-N6)-methyltransferase
VLSYRHAYHAGNHADVLKHSVLVALLEHLTLKDSPLWYIDTHAGAGIYALDRPPASEHREHARGIGRLWPLRGSSGPLARYLAVVQAANPDDALLSYPGSPWFARALLRRQDKLWLFDRHPAEFASLQRAFPQKNIKVANTDGLAALRALLPPAPRRALVMIDPAYEQKSEYVDVPSALGEALERFSTGTYMLWYPRIAGRDAESLLQRLDALRCPRWLHASLDVGHPGPDTPNLFGSGVFVVNPPHTLPAMLEASLPLLQDSLALDDGARWHLDHALP